MTAGQLQKFLDRAGLSQRGAAKALEINERTMRKYVSGDSEIPRTVEFSLLYLACSQQAFDRVKELESVLLSIRTACIESGDLYYAHMASAALGSH